MTRYRVRVKLERIETRYEYFFVDADDDRGAKQEALETAERAYPEFDNATAERPVRLSWEDEE